VRIAIILLLALAACGPRRATLPDGRPRYVALADGTVRDDRTGLVWSGDGGLAAAGLTWDEARTFVAAMNQGGRPNLGHTDWRLPTVGELSVLFDGFWARRSRLGCVFSGEKAGCVERLPSDPFVSLSSEAYWSSTAPRNDANRVYAVGMGVAPVNAMRTERHGLLTVRGAPQAAYEGKSPLLPRAPLAP
jgi:hypothetical protein